MLIQTVLILSTVDFTRCSDVKVSLPRWLGSNRVVMVIV